MAGPDQLYTLKSLYWLGSYQVCSTCVLVSASPWTLGSSCLSAQPALSEAATLHPSEPSVVEARDVLVYRTYIALKQFSVVLGEVKADATPALQAVRLLATHSSTSGAERERAVADLGLLAESSQDATAVLLYGTALAAEGRNEEALKVVDSGVTAGDAECSALRVVVLLAMNRADLAHKTAKAMLEADDDNALAQLCGAWVGLVVGGNQLGEASLVFGDLASRFGSSALLLNGQAAALLALGRTADAKKLLADAAGKAPGDESTTINMVAAARQAGESDEFASRFLSCVFERSVFCCAHSHLPPDSLQAIDIWPPDLRVRPGTSCSRCGAGGHPEQVCRRGRCSCTSVVNALCLLPVFLCILFALGHW